jgi:D-alanine-D-alanine ligase
MQNKLRVGVLYGGRSGEHEISLASAASVISHLDPQRYEAVPIRIEKDGRWTLAARAPLTIKAADVIDAARARLAEAASPEREAYLAPRPGAETLLTIDRAGDEAATPPDPGRRANAHVAGLGLDVVFPVLHGPYGEDGTVQGLLELANIAYVGSGVLGSAVSMDKAAMKQAFAAAGLPIVAHRTVLRREWQEHRARVAAALLSDLPLPLFVKPANLGSSVGISKVKTPEQLDEAMDAAGSFDRKIVIEAGVPHAREIECGVLGNDQPDASVPGEVRPSPSREFYDYEAKYLDDDSETIIPAPLSDAQTREVQRLALAAFRAVDAAGFARVDFLLDGESGALYVNEVNTIPGFTTISMFPKLWDASGVSYGALLDRLIALAIARHDEKQQLKTSV